MFPLIFDCNEKILQPITSRFKGFGEQLAFIDLVLENLFSELNNLKSNQGIDIKPNVSFVKNRIHRHTLLNTKNNQYNIVFHIEGTSNFYFFDPNAGTFNKVENVLEFLSGDFILLSDELKNKLTEIEKKAEVNSLLPL
jgi:hypothetical protein